MSTPVNASMVLSFTSIDQFSAAEGPGAGTSSIKQDQFNKSISMNANATVPLLADAFYQPVLSAGTLVIDFTSLFKLGGGTQDMTAKRLIALLFTNTSTHNVDLGPNGSNAYPLFGSTNKITVYPGDTVAKYFGANLAVVGPTVKQILLTGTGTDSFNLALGFG